MAEWRNGIAERSRMAERIGGTENGGTEWRDGLAERNGMAERNYTFEITNSELCQTNR